MSAVAGSVARRYAQALFDLGSENGALEELEADLARAVETVSRQPVLQKTLYHPLISVDEKRQLVEALLSGKVSPRALNFLRLILEKKRERHLPVIMEEFRRLVNAARNVVDVEASVASPLSDPLLAELRGKLESVTGKRVNLTVSLNPSLLGGVVVQIGDRRFDGSLRGRLESLRHSIREARISGEGVRPQ